MPTLRPCLRRTHMIVQRYMTLADAARFLGKTESALRNRVHRRSIPFGRDGATIVFDRLELERYMKGCRQTTDAAPEGAQV